MKLWIVLLAGGTLHAQVRVTPSADKITIEINGAPFGALFFGAEANKPYFHPITSASGKRVTRSFPMERLRNEPDDHPHQRGLWFGHEKVTTSEGWMDFWENEPSYKERPKGKIVLSKLIKTQSGEATGSFTVEFHWFSPGGQKVLTETRTMTFHSKPTDARMFDTDITIRAEVPVKFEDLHDGTFGMRLVPEFDEKRGARIRNAEGREQEIGVWGQRSPWVDYTATIDGEQIGAAIFDHPENFKYPTRWHIRGYGLYCANPYGEGDFLHDPSKDGGKKYQSGQTERLRYRVLVHSPKLDVGAAFRDYAGKR